VKYFRVRNWEKFQHYKDRNPPWIKLHTELLDNYEFSRLQDASKLLAVCIWMLAARSDNKIPADPEWIKGRANLKGEPDIEPLLDGGFIEWIQELQSPEQDASDPLAECLQDACALTEERRDREEGAKTKRASSAPPPVPDFDAKTVPGLDLEAWERWLEHRKAIKKPIRPHSMRDAAEELAKLGDRQLAEVKRARAGGWQGLHPEESKATGNSHQRAPVQAKVFPS